MAYDVVLLNMHTTLQRLWIACTAFAHIN